MQFQKLYETAKAKLNPRVLSRSTVAGVVAAAIETEAGNIYTGVNIDAPCSVGYCAEHAAIAAMVTAGENRIVKMVAVFESGEIIPPCGRCREFICQLHDDNASCQVMLKDRIATIAELLPDRWN